MNYSDVLIEHMEKDENMKGCKFLLLLKEDKRLKDWINSHAKYKIINLFPHPNSGELLNFILRNYDSKEGLSLIDVLETSPNHLDELMVLGSSPVMAKKSLMKSNDMKSTINKFVKGIGTITGELKYFMLESEYKDNFHRLFSTVEPITQEETDRLVKAWISITKGFSNRVGIINENEELIFVHPGLVSRVDVSGINNTWLTFTHQSEIRENKMKGMKESFQEAYIEKYISSLEGVMDLEGKAVIDYVTNYYDYILYGNKEEVVEIPKVKEKKEDWSNDLFE